MNEAWTCEHGKTHEHEPPCVECCMEVEDAEPQMTEEDWTLLWDTFVDSPTWVQLDPLSQRVFKKAWYERALPLFATIIRAVGDFDLAQKAKRN